MKIIIKIWWRYIVLFLGGDIRVAQKEIWEKDCAPLLQRRFLLVQYLQLSFNIVKF